MIGQLSSTLEDSCGTVFTLFPLVILSTNFWSSYYRYFKLKKKKKDEKFGKKIRGSWSHWFQFDLKYHLLPEPVPEGNVRAAQ